MGNNEKSPPRMNPNYGYGEIDENVPKSGCAAAHPDFGTFSVIVQ